MLNITRLLSTAALAGVLLGSSAYAADVPAVQTDATQTSTTSTATTPDSAKMEAHVETRIKTLHDGLKITPDQESQWATVAQTMRDNEATLAPLYEAHKTAEKGTALDNMKSHQALSAAYADGFSKFIASFEPLYNSMSDEQKKSADSFFAKEDTHMDKGMKHTSKTTTTTTTTGK